MRYFLFCVAFLIISPAAIGADRSTNELDQKAVLVTGASSGIGRKIAETLAARGAFVYAGARKQSDLDALSAQKNMQGVRLDVTKPQEIAAAVDLVEHAGRGLHAVVNNAGVFLHAPLIEVSERDMQFIMDVNVFGPYRVTKAFAPLLIANKGRVTTIGSIAGLGTGAMFGPYSMSKYAMEAYTDALASEMTKFGVQVSIVEPGNFKSNIMRNMLKRQAKEGGRTAKTLFAEEYQRMSSFAQADRSQHQEPDAVANAVVHALFSQDPKRRYMVVPNQREADSTLRGLLRTVTQLNEGHDYMIDNAALKSMLDELQN